MTDWPTWLAVAMGGSAGALLRGIIFRAIEKMGPVDGGDFAWANYGSARATLIVNVLGSLILGLIVGGQWERLAHADNPWRVFWLTGLCGALTTFSTLCADVVALAQAGKPIHGGGVLAAHLVLGISALALGLSLAG